MTWFRVDDVLTFHPRVLQAGNAAVGVWVRAGAWSMAHLTDGFIPVAVAKQIGSSAEIRKLVASGLWYEVDGGYQFHAWAETGDGTPRQPTREQVEAKRRRDRERKSALGKRGAEDRWNGAENDEDSARNPGGVAAASDSPVPSRPVPLGTDTQIGPVLETGDEAPDGLDVRSKMFGFDGDRIRAELTRLMGRFPDDETVMTVSKTILGRAKNWPDDPTAFLVGSFRRYPEEATKIAHGGAA